MQRLIDNKLIFGSLFEVATETLRERYNRALELLTGRGTELARFRIDLTGFSPEVAEELDDPFYLNPHGCNRRFILLTLEQETLPVIGATFSTTRAILCHFIADNRAALFALTARDAVYGELENSVYRIESLQDLLSIQRIRVDVRTTRQLIAKARRLSACISSFEEDDDAWHDDTLLNEIIELAQETGDIREQPIMPAHIDYEQGNFYTTHFDGLYAFLAAATPTLVYRDAKQAARHAKIKALKDYDHIALDDGPRLARFLEEAALATRLTEADGRDALLLLKPKLDFIVIDQVAQADERVALDRLGAEDIKRYIHLYFDRLPPAFHLLAGMIQALEQDAPLPEAGGDSEGFFYLLRAAAHGDRDLVNHLLAHLMPLDVRQLFICNKELFYEHYPNWPESKRAFVTRYLSDHYLADKQALRALLFGDDRARARPPRRKSRIPRSGRNRAAN